MRDRTQHHQKHHQHHRTQANLISIAVLFIFYLLTPIKTYADQPTSPSPTPTSLEIQRTTVGIKGKVLANSDYDVIIPIDTYYKVIFDSTGGSAVSMQFVKENCNAIEPAAPTRANYEFNFWVEKGTYEEFNFTTTPITHDITLKAVWTSTSPSSSPSPSPSDENKPNTDKEDTNSSENTKDTTDDKENSSDNKDENTETKEGSSDNKDKSSETNGEDSKSSESNDGLSNTSEENTETNTENTDESTETTDESNKSNDGLINTHTNPSSNHSKTSTSSIETDPDIATNTETTDLISEIKATVLGVFKTIKTSITIVAKISLIGILIWFIWFVILLNNTLVKIQAPSEDQPDQPDQPDQSKSQSQSQSHSQSWKTVYLTPIKKTIEQTVGDKRTIWSSSLPQNLLDDNEELKVKIPWSVYHRAEDTNQTELHITIVNQDQQQSPSEPTMIYIITNETKEIKIK